MHFLLTPETGYTRFPIGYTNKVGINKTLVKQQHRDGMGSELSIRNLQFAIVVPSNSSCSCILQAAHPQPRIHVPGHSNIIGGILVHAPCPIHLLNWLRAEQRYEVSTEARTRVPICAHFPFASRLLVTLARSASRGPRCASPTIHN